VSEKREREGERERERERERQKKETHASWRAAAAGPGCCTVLYQKRTTQKGDGKLQRQQPLDPAMQASKQAPKTALQSPSAGQIAGLHCFVRNLTHYCNIRLSNCSILYILLVILDALHLVPLTLQ